MSAARSSLSDALVARARRLDQAALKILEAPRLNPQQVHRVRVTSKELRGLWQLVRGLREKTADQASNRLAAAARTLGGARDRHVMEATLIQLARESRRSSEQQALEQARQCLFPAAGEDPGVAAPEQVRQAFADDLADWRALRIKGGDEALLDQGLRRSWRKIRNRILKALDSDRLEDWHALRKWIKYLGYQLQWLERCGLESPLPAARMQEFGRDLGRLHDLHVLISHVRDQVEQFPDRDAAGYCLHLLRRHEGAQLQHCAVSAVHLTQIKPGELSRQLQAQISAPQS